MSDEESFVILGSSPMSSLELNGDDEHIPALSTSGSSECDSPSNFSPLKNSQLNDLQSAREAIEEKVPSQMVTSHMENKDCQDTKFDIKRNSAIEVEKNSMENMEPTKTVNQNDESKLWSRTPQINKDTDDELSLSFEDCAIKSLSSSRKQEKTDSSSSLKQMETSKSKTNGVGENTCSDNHSEPSVSMSKSLATSFIMGEVNADVLKTSVYSQFPSISVHSSAEEILKLQNMVTENMQLKGVLEKVNSTMRFFHSSSLQWQEKMSNMETKYKQELDDCQKQIEKLRNENQILKDNLNDQIEAIEIARQKDREETIKEISEKNSLIENMRAEIVKLEQQHLSSFEFLTKNDIKKYNYISREEHEAKIKDIERQLSAVYASNLDLKDMEKQYIDELNCLKVNLTSAEELIKENYDKILQLQGQIKEKLEKTKQLEQTIKDLRQASAEQNERILVLEQQNEVYRKDFEMERESRSMAVKEKQEMLKDLKTLQKRNQELIAEHQKLLDIYEKDFKSKQNSSLTSAAAAAQTYINNPQRPIRNLPSTSSNSQTLSSTAPQHSCPICNKAFKSLNILQSHVNDCIDKN